MSKNCYKTEEVPPLKKSIINKVEKQYGKDNPKTYATLWKIYKDKKKNEDVPSTSTAGVVGTGDDSSTVVVKNKPAAYDANLDEPPGNFCINLLRLKINLWKSV